MFLTRWRRRAPGGDKISEQFLKNAGGKGLRPCEWPVRRWIFFYEESERFGHVIARLTKEGEPDSRFVRDPVAENRWARLRTRGP